ncbi:MAG: amidohydrolase family protein [Rhodomicrobium sp.]
MPLFGSPEGGSPQWPREKADYPGLVRDGAWVRLSGAFRTSVQGPPYADTVPFARALQEASPERCVWGSDWPHVANWGPMPNVGDLLDLVADWVPDEAGRQKLFADNPPPPLRFWIG